MEDGAEDGAEGRGIMDTCEGGAAVAERVGPSAGVEVALSWPAEWPAWRVERASGWEREIERSPRPEPCEFTGIRPLPRPGIHDMHCYQVQ